VSIFIESRYKVTWRSKVEIDHTVWSISSHNLLRVNVKTRLSVPTLMKSKRDEEMYFIFNFEYRYVALSRRMLHRLLIKSHTQQKPKYLSKMSETQWPHTLDISLNQGKLDGPVFQTGGSYLGGWAPITSFLIPDVPVTKTRCSNFYWLVSND
jgi:hypothetical protein